MGSHAHPPPHPQALQVRKEEGEELGKVLLGLVIARQTGFRGSGSGRCLRLPLSLMNNFEKNSSE